jgi:iron complex outermembrane receptor protein
MAFLLTLGCAFVGLNARFQCNDPHARRWLRVNRVNQETRTRMAFTGPSGNRRFRFAAVAPLAKLAVASAVAVMCALPCGARPAEQLLEFDIAGGPLVAVLLQIAQTSGELISFDPRVVERRHAPAVRGAYTLQEALTLTTRPSGLVVETTLTGVLTIVEPPPAPADMQALQRPPGSASSSTAGALPGEAAVVLPRVVVRGSNGLQEDGLKALRGSSATRTDTLLADLPQSISVLTGESLDLQGNPTSTEALRYVTGVSSRIDVSGGQGIVPSLLVRGLPALYASSGMGTIGTALPMDNIFIERIEVPKGPSNVISGVASFGGRGGVVNLVRKEAGGDPHKR